VAGRVGKHAEPCLALRRKSSGTQGEDGAFGRIDIINSNVKMKLLWVLRIGANVGATTFPCAERRADARQARRR
jgi:hypothetical protein